MIDAALRAQYLQRLGIVPYIPRSHLTEQTPLDSPVHWQGPDDASVVFVFKSCDTTIDWSLPPYALLKKIMDAVAMPTLSMALCFSALSPMQLPDLPKTTRVVVFGSGLTQSFRPGTIETLPLAELQQHDLAKRNLWQELKAMKAVYGC